MDEHYAPDTHTPEISKKRKHTLRDQQKNLTSSNCFMVQNLCKFYLCWLWNSKDCIADSLNHRSMLKSNLKKNPKQWKQWMYTNSSNNQRVRSCQFLAQYRAVYCSTPETGAAKNWTPDGMTRRNLASNSWHLILEPVSGVCVMGLKLVFTDMTRTEGEREWMQREKNDIQCSQVEVSCETSEKSQQSSALKAGLNDFWLYEINSIIT